MSSVANLTSSVHPDLLDDIKITLVNEPPSTLRKFGDYHSNMAMFLQISTFLHQCLYARQHAITSKAPTALRIGVLSTAMINSASIFRPAQTHPDVTIHAIASRNAKKAAEEAKKYGIPKSYGSYDALLDDQEVEAVYISLPNGMHYGESSQRRWANTNLERT